jgi:hypothetical protein
MFAAKDTLLTRPSGGYQISRSLRFNSADSAYLNRTPASATNRRTYTFSAWVKRSKGTDFKTIFSAATDTSNLTIIRFKDDEKIEVRSATGGSTVFQLVTTQVFRDFSAWYHFVLAVDTTNATGGDRVRLYVNGSEVTAFDTDTNPTQNADSWVNYNILHEIGRQANNASNYYQDGYMTEMYLIDGTQLTPSSFGETNAQTGVWQPKAYSGSYGTNGFYLNFSDNSNTTAATLGKDYSGNGNNWTPNNFSVTAGAGNDSLVDSPTSYGTDTGAGGTVRGNYATWNPLAKGGSFTNAPTNGNLDIISATTPNYGTALATMGMISGKWYWEVTNNAGTAAQSIGLAKDGVNLDSFLGSNTFGWTYLITGQTQTNGTGASYGASYTTNDIIGVAFDADAGTLVFYKNGTSQGTAFSGLTSGYYYPAVGDDSGANQASYTINFGQRPFAYTAPSGFKALCTQNLPTPTIGATTATQAGKYFNTVTYTGTGSSLGVTGVGFQPDWVWAKGRSGATDHGLYDAVRGVQKQLESNNTGAETTETTGITAFGSDGFTTGALAQLNTSSATYVAWNWKANGSGSSNTSGSITSTVSASTTSGFSIVTYTGNNTAGATVGHGLGVAPSMIIVKGRTGTSGSDHWAVYHASLGATKYLNLNQTLAGTTSSFFWNDTSPTSTIWTNGSGAQVNNSSTTYVAYCFAPVAGYSAFGSYTGNGSADGPFVFTGFRPAFVMTKRTDSTSEWTITDLRRPGYNLVNKSLYANRVDAELTYNVLDQVSNGFKLRDSDGIWNGSGGTYIYMAFAEFPFKYSLAR